MSITAMRKIIAACAAWVGIAFAAPKIWDGTADTSWYESGAQAYNLTTAEQLAGLAKLVNDSVSDFKGKTITLGADIFLNDTTGAGAGTWANAPHRSWTPIGSKSRPFRGEFDGIAGKKNRKIYGLFISDTTKDYVGLFGYASMAKISNLDILVGSVVAKDTVGALVGYANGSVKNVHSEVLVTGKNYVGGVAGCAGGTIGSIDSVYHVEGDVSGYNYVGGLAGKASYITNSYSEGSVKGDSDYVGGLAGYAYGVDSSYHIGGDVIGKGYVGGLVGQVGGSVSNSHSEGNVTGYGNYVGGLIGMFYGKIFYSDNDYVRSKVWSRSVINSYSKGDIKGVDYVGGALGLDSFYRESSDSITLKMSLKKINVQGKVNGKNFVGGIAGKVHYGYSGSDSISNASYFISMIDSCEHTDGAVAGDGYVGGLFGFSYGLLKNSVSKADVIGTGMYVGGIVGYTTGILDSVYCNGEEVRGSQYVGGLAGTSFNSIMNSHFEGDSVSGTQYVGGLVGGQYYQYVVKANSVIKTNSVIRNSHSKGYYVSGTSYVGGLAGVANLIDFSYASFFYVSGTSEVGGLAGKCSGNVTDSYFEGNYVKGTDSVGGLVGYLDGNVKYSFSTADVYGNEDIGGLIGYFSGDSVRVSWAIGDVFGRKYLGGLIGRSSPWRKSVISKSYANGDVTVTNNSKYTAKYIGGLIGSASGTIEESYASGIVTDDENRGIYSLGCLMGEANSLYNDVKIDRTYYDKTKCSADIVGEGGYSHIFTSSSGKTTNEMKKKKTFDGWSGWNIKEKTTYPFFSKMSLKMAKVKTSSLEGFVYDGTAKTPNVISVNFYDSTLVYGSDYTISYEKNENAGVGSINVCGLGSFEECKIVYFKIAGIAVEPTIAPIESMTYTGETLTPKISVYIGDSLFASSSYTVEYKDNVNAGLATVSVTMKGNYSGTASKTFKIEKATPIISQNPKASDIVIGETLSLSVLTGGKANVEGKFVWKNPIVKPSLENEGYAVVFIPKDSVNYKNSAEIVILIKVLDVAYIALHESGVTIDSSVVVKESNYILPKASDRIGYDFMGYYSGEKFIGKSGDTITVNEDVILEAVYQLKNYEVTFKNGTEILQTSDFAYGSIPVYNGSIPTKSSIGECSYSFKGWYPTLTPVTKSATYTAVFDSSFAVVFKNGETELQKSYEAYGSMPIYNGSTPTKASTGRCEYTFKDWNPTLASVTKPATYTAVFDSSFIIVFKNGVTVLQSSAEAYGAKPQYIGTTPTKASAKYYYSFKGWRPSLAIVKDSATYTAVFDSTLRDYAISFKNGTTTLQKKYVDYGTKPSYTGETPTKASSDKYTYTFKGWKPTIVSVTDSATYQAVFDSTLRKYAVTFKNGSTTLQTSEIAYGSKPSYTGNTPTKASDKYTYKFKGWNPAIATVTKTATYQAVFDSTKVTGIIENRLASLDVTVRAVSRSIQISAASKNSTYTVLDMQGRVLLRGRAESSNFNIAVPRAGCYLVRVGNATRKVQVK